MQAPPRPAVVSSYGLSIVLSASNKRQRVDSDDAGGDSTSRIPSIRVAVVPPSKPAVRLRQDHAGHPRSPKGLVMIGGRRRLTARPPRARVPHSTWGVMRETPLQPSN